MNSQFSAPSQALGYFYQAIYALYLILSSPEDTEIRIEGLDDIDFQHNGAPAELLQLKHHSTHQASLSDSSPDLWKSIRIWCSHLKDGNIFLPETILSLVTTAKAPEKSVSAILRPGSLRDPESACNTLAEIAETSKNVKLRPAFTAFQSLSSCQQQALVNAIFILDGSPDISDTGSLIREKLRFGIHREHQEAVYERLQGWWLEKVIRHLKNKSLQSISGFEVTDKIAFIADQFKPDALPIDFIKSEPSAEYDWGTRQFVSQLKAVSIRSRRIQKAISDYYRAFEQRSRWAREELLSDDELEIYEQKLTDEWERCYDRLCDEYLLEHEIPVKEADEKDQVEFGQKILGWMEESEIPIRPQVTEPYVMQGSYHILADKANPRIYWHPTFLERLKTVLEQTEGETC